MKIVSTYTKTFAHAHMRIEMRRDMLIGVKPIYITGFIWKSLLVGKPAVSTSNHKGFPAKILPDKKHFWENNVHA